jgi:UDP-GlcNAc:undecaprenyl-phosphate GlcNAc-1-phosphate transferase
LTFSWITISPTAYLLAFGLTLTVSLALTGLLIRLAPKLGLVDIPNARKVHVIPTPKGGGIAIFVAFLVGNVALALLNSGEAWIILGLGTAITLLGLADDIWALTWQVRLLVQTGVAVAAVLFLPIGLPSWMMPVAVVWIVGMTNAFNMLDNMDWLSAGTACIATAICAVAVVFQSADASVLALTMILGGIAGFLWYNRPPARIFMGDAGSTFLGFFLGVRTLRVDMIDANKPESWLVPLLLLAVPVYDLATVVILRLSQGRSPFHADKQHLSHRLVELGLSKRGSVRTIHILAVANGLGALALYWVSPRVAFLIFGVAALWWAVLASIEFLPRLSPAGSEM